MLLSRFYNSIYIANFNRRKRNNNSRRTYVHGYNATGLIITAMTFFAENRIPPSAGHARRRRPLDFLNRRYC